MSTTANTSLDRRFRPRTAINSQIKYKLSGDANFRTGILIDLSQTGALIEIDQALFVKTRLNLIINTDDAPLEMSVEIARIAETINDDQYIYGCVILDIVDF